MDRQTRFAWGLAACLLLVAGARAAAVVRSESVLEVEVVAPPLRFEEGDGGARDRFVDATVSANGTSFTLQVTGRVGADTSVRDVVRLANAGGSSRSVTLHGTQVSDAEVVIYTWTVRDGATTLATLDMRGPSPSATFSVPASDNVELDLRLKVAKGADPLAAGFTSDVWAVLG